MFNVITNNRATPIMVDVGGGEFHRPAPMGAQAIDFFLAGHRVGDFLGAAFRRDTPRRRWAAARKASEDLKRANDDAVNAMLASGVAEVHMNAWAGGFTEAMIPHAIAWNFGDT